MKRLAGRPIDVVISDVNMPGQDGFHLLSHVRTKHPATQVVLVTGYGTIESAVRGMREGAFDYVTKPVLDEEMLLVVERALESVRLRAENAELRAALDKTKAGRRIIGNDPSLLRVFDTIEAVAPTRATVLVTGESGTGKSLLSRMVHDASPRRSAPFIEMNCGALPEGLLESELFGHTKGAFTGASGARSGRFLAADKGTLFLDEIGASTPALQLKLLRVLQERRFEPVGSEESIEVDVRLILATNEDLAKAVAEGRFRQDLYYRISVVPIHLPSLRERIGDVPLLAQHFLKRFAADNGKKIAGIDDSTMTVLQAHAWPGNIRELENVIERGVILARGDVLMPGDLPPELTRSAPAPEQRPQAAAQAGARDPGARDHRADAAVARVEPPAHRPRARHQPHDALQQDAQVRAARQPGRRPRGVDLSRPDPIGFRDGSAYRSAPWERSIGSRSWEPRPAFACRIPQVESDEAADPRADDGREPRCSCRQGRRRRGG